MSNFNISFRVASKERFTSIIKKSDLQVVYSNKIFSARKAALANIHLGPLQSIFESFLLAEEQLEPLPNEELAALFEQCCDATQSPEQLVDVLHRVAPGGKYVGYQQVLFFVEYLRARVARFLLEKQYDAAQLLPHDHVFGSGGDFCKTIHASTAAAILASPLVRICKTGTTNVTSSHGSSQAMTELGYSEMALEMQRVNNELATYNYSFIPLSMLGFPYSRSLKAARARLWNNAMEHLLAVHKSSSAGWQSVVKQTPLVYDLFKIVSPNALVLNPVHHSTGVCHMGMFPYVIGLYLHLGAQGIITHAYDGIDEFSNASSDDTPYAANNLLVHVQDDAIVITECAPEDVGFKRASLSAIREDPEPRSINDDFWRILHGSERGPKRDFVVANAALLLVAAGQTSYAGADLLAQVKAAIPIIEQLIDTGKASANFSALLASRNHSF